jgi:glycosyltransferase involved in cell wall biosynthesis
MRTCSLLHFLAQRFRVHLMTFWEQDSPNPETYLPKDLVERITSIHLPSHNKRTVARIYRNTGRLIRGQLPLTARFTDESSLRRVALATQNETYAVAVIEHFWCACYLDILRARARSVVLDLHNVESALHEHCSRTEPWPNKIGHSFFRRTARRMERSMLAEFDLVLVTSEADRERVLGIAPTARVGVYPNAVPWVELPAAPEENIIAFSGNLEYHPNVSGVRYFRREIWPAIKAAQPGLRWRLIGKNDGVIRPFLSDDPAIECTGPVADAVIELARAKVVVVPLLAGSGTRVKILEAWAAGRAVVSTSVGAEGLPAVDGWNIRIADTPEAMSATVLELLADRASRQRLGAAGRAVYEEKFCWPAAWKTLEPQVSSVLSPPSFAAAM